MPRPHFLNLVDGMTDLFGDVCELKPSTSSTVESYGSEYDEK